MILVGKQKEEFMELSDEFFSRFGDDIPLMQLDGVDFEHLKESVQKCFDANEDLLSEIYGWKYDGSKIY